jgi:hypothetical protein
LPIIDVVEGINVLFNTVNSIQNRGKSLFRFKKVGAKMKTLKSRGKINIGDESGGKNEIVPIF